MDVGVVVANLGSPASPSRRDVHRFLAEFLTDPYVVDLPSPFRQLLVRGLIAPLRSNNSSQAYASIWHWEEGPLRKFTRDIANALGQHSGFRVVVGMRYGEPSLLTAMKELGDVRKIVLLPIYPQHADSTRTTMIESARRIGTNAELAIVPPFYDREEYINVLTRQVRRELHNDIEHVVLSFHSLPLRHIRKADPTQGHCLESSKCCEMTSVAHATCYRHQCLATANSLGRGLQIPYSIAFQSRLGRLKWLEPSTIDIISRLASKQIKKIGVVCPAFTVDNLETLEEIGIQAKEQFKSLGGEKLQLVPSLNSEPEWIGFLTKLIEEQIDPSKT